MPKLTHEALVTILRNAPTLLVDLLWPDRRVPASSIHIAHCEFVDLNLPQYRADDAILLGADPRAPERALIGEAQTSPDPDKRLSWPHYVTSLHARYRCPVDLVVLTVDREVAAWASRPITAGLLPGALTITPTVIGPDQIPRITDLEEARRSPELAVLSAVAHGDEPGAEVLAFAALAATSDLDSDRGLFYPDLILHHLAPVARALLEGLMAAARYEPQSDIARKWYFEGRARGKTEGEASGEAKMLLRLLEHRGLALTDAERERILACADLEELERWAARVLTVRSADELFAR